MWNIGATARVVSPRRVSRRASTLTVFHHRFPWVRTTPLGRPVLPEVYISTAMSSSASASGSIGPAPSRRTTVDSRCRQGAGSPVTGAAGSVSTSRRRRTGISGATASTSARYSSSAIRVCAPESLRTWAASEAASRELTGTNTAPRQAAAKNASSRVALLRPR